MARPLKDKNPFFYWINPYERDRNSTFYVPDTKLVPLICKHLGFSLEQLIDAPKSRQLNDLIQSFQTLWTGSYLDRYGIKLEKNKIDGCEFTKSLNLGSGQGKVQFVDGWISKTYLNVYLRRAVLQDSENGGNPFNSFMPRKTRIAFLPDITYLPKLYERLGIRNLEQTGLTVADYDDVWESDDQLVINLAYGTVLFGEKIGLMWQTYGNNITSYKDVWYLERFPETVLKRLAVKVEVLKNRGGGSAPLSSVPRDILQKITNPALKGKDLIGLCIQNVAANRYCNQNDQQLFKDRLLSEFNLNWNLEKQNTPTPRELYVQMHRQYYEVIPIDPDFDRNADDLESNYALNHLPLNQSWEKDAVLRIVPDPSWPENSTHFIFFFPDAPDIYFIVHQDYVTKESIYQRTGRILVYLSEAELKEFVDEYLKLLPYDGHADIPRDGKWGNFIAQIATEDEDPDVDDRVYIFGLGDYKQRIGI